jgi:hypothetical protein
LAFAVEFGLPPVRPLDEAGGGRLGILRVDPLLLADALLFSKPRGPRIPVIDFADKAGAPSRSSLAISAMRRGRTSFRCSGKR